MIYLLQNDPRQYVAIVLVVIVSIVLHEIAHGLAAVRLGDNTPIDSGHMDTLNPLVHMGATSLILLAVVGVAFGAMPINPSRLRGKYAESLVAFAGPAANLLLAIVAILALGLWFRFSPPDTENPVAANGMMLLEKLGVMNIALMLFNLLPIPPLDGSRVAANVIPAYRRLLDSGTAQGVMIAIFFALFFGGARLIFDVAERAWLGGVLLVAGA